jgi:hypothetical protein
MLRYHTWILITAIFSLAQIAADTGYTPASPHLPVMIDPSHALVSDMQALDHLIEMTQKSLDQQRALKNMLIEYQKLQEFFFKNDQDKEVMFRMVKTAHKLLETIKENHLLHLFNADFLSELTLFSQIATKKGIPKP